MKEDRTTKGTEKTTAQPLGSDQTLAELWVPQTPDTQSGPDRIHLPKSHPTAPTCSQHPKGCPTGYTQDQMRTRIRELMSLVALLEAEMPLIESADIVEPAVWSSVALMLREVANRSLLLRQQALALAAEALESGHQTSGTLGLF